MVATSTASSLSPAPVFAAVSDRPEFWADVGYQAVGMTVVMLALGGLWLGVSLLGRLVRAVERLTTEVAKARAVVPASPAPAPVAGASSPGAPTATAAPGVVAGAALRGVAPADTDEISTAEMAAIAAAIAAVMEQPYRIVELTPLSGTSPWSVEGRREIAQSHRVR